MYLYTSVHKKPAMGTSNCSTVPLVSKSQKNNKADPKIFISPVIVAKLLDH